MRRLLLIPAVLGPLLLAGPVSAQTDGWIKVKRQSPATVLLVEPRPPKMVGLEFGYPGVFAPRVHFPVSGRHAAGIGPVLLPGLIGMVGEYRYHLTLPRRQKFSFYSGGAVTLYDIRSDDRSASCLGLFLSLGGTYLTGSNFVLGGSVGLLATGGSNETDPVESFGIRKGKSTATVNFSVYYVF